MIIRAMPVMGNRGYGVGNKNSFGADEITDADRITLKRANWVMDQVLAGREPPDDFELLQDPEILGELWDEASRNPALQTASSTNFIDNALRLNSQEKIPLREVLEARKSES